MSRESVRAILISFANHIADNCVLADDEWMDGWMSVEIQALADK